MSQNQFQTKQKKDLQQPNTSIPDTTSLLSIDVNAHLQKVAASTYRSAAHYPVELVRCAIIRGATRIQININKKRLEINDNGTGINQLQMEKLCTLLESDQSINKREQSILDLQNHLGIGLLAIFSPSPTQIFIRNISNSQKVQILYKNGRFHRSSTPQYTGPRSGTQIVLTRKTTDVDMEKLILQTYCQYAEAKIVMNGQHISQKSYLKNSLISMKMPDKENQPRGRISIPKGGDVCRIWQLDHGILLTRKTFAPWKGLIFEAIVEYSGEITASFLSILLENIHKLYLYLINNYKKIPLKYQPRIEELIFKHHRLTHNTHLVNLFYPFKTAGSSSFFSLPQLQKKAEKGKLYGILNEGKSPFKTANNRDVLILSPTQIDYLVNYICLPIRLLQPTFFRIHPINQLKFLVLKVIRNIIKRKKVKEKRIIPSQLLSDEEKIFIKELHLYVSKNKDPESKGYSQPVMIKSKGLLPTVTTKESEYTRELFPARIVLRQNHQLVKKAVQMVFYNRENIKWIAPLFTE